MHTVDMHEWRGFDLGPEERTRVSGAIAELAAELTGWALEQGDPSLSGGDAGVALLFAYLTELEGEDADARAERAVDLAEHALVTAVTEQRGAALYGGLIGPAWVLAHLDGWLLELAPSGDPNDVIDEAVLDVLRVPTWHQEFDLISGLVGLGVYALERRNRPSAVRVLEGVVAHLSALAERDRDGVTWHTAADLLPAHQRAVAPHGYHNLGVAHGVPGVIGLLASIGETEIDPAATAALLEGAVEWVLAHQLPGGGFAPWIDGTTDPRRSRLAWCYGDPGVAAMVLRASCVAGRGDWADAATQLARHAAARPVADSGVTNAGLCHGAAGLALVYGRLWQHTGDDRLHAAARCWVTRTLDLLPSMTESSWLEGRAGVALALLAAMGTEPAWDRLLLLSGPSEQR